MENLTNKIAEVQTKFGDKSISLLGFLHDTSFSNMGKCMILNLKGDVPLGMKPVEIVMVHPESKDGGWVGIGGIALNAYSEGAALIDKVPLCDEAINQLKDIYFLYTGKKFTGCFSHQNNINEMTFGSTLRFLS